MSNILLLQIYDDKQKLLSDITSVSAKAYVKKHNIDYVRINVSDIFVSEFSDIKWLTELHPAWAKIWIFVFVDFYQYDYVWVLDIDTFFVNYEINIADIINFHFTDDSIDAICSVNGLNGGKLLNTGSIIYSCEMIGALHNLISLYKEKNNIDLNQPFWEQDFLNYIYEIQNNHFTIKPLEMNVLNSHWFNYEHDQLLFHFMARSYEEKIKIATEHIIEKKNPFTF